VNAFYILQRRSQAIATHPLEDGGRLSEPKYW
jgi:hypothetical protein